jgi:hypothetical protein
MNVSYTAAPDSSAGPEALPEPYSTSWWQGRTPEELREIVDRGFAGGQVYHDAMVELERRGEDAMRQMRDEAAANSRRKALNRLATLAWVLMLLIVAFAWKRLMP